MIHPKKGSPSGRNAYPVTEKIEEFKKEKKNDMAKKKTFQEYTQEALLEIEKTEAALKQAKLEKEQAEHRIQRSLNYLDTQKKKKRKARTHLLIQKGAAIEAICKDTKYLTEAEFYQLMDELLHDPACKFCDVVHEMVRGRAKTAEAKEREFAEEEALLKAMQRGELPRQHPFRRSDHSIKPRQSGMEYQIPCRSATRARWADASPSPPVCGNRQWW